LLKIKECREYNERKLCRTAADFSAGAFSHCQRPLVPSMDLANRKYCFISFLYRLFIYFLLFFDKEEKAGNEMKKLKKYQ
jgi:hypothetical protein